MDSRSLLVTSFWISLFVPVVASAQNVILDQWNDSPGANLRWSVEGFLPVQEFTPRLFQIEFVEFWITRYENGPDAAALGVSVLDHTGGLWGTSQSTAVLPGHDGPIRVLFSPPVDLRPGQVHRLRLEQQGVGYSVLVSDDRYERGILRCDRGRETEHPSLDLWFREGLLEPLPVLDRSWGAIKRVYRP